MIVRVTEKLAKKIKVTPAQSLPEHENPFADWSANLFTFERSQFVLVCNTASLYSFVMLGRGLTSERIFLKQMALFMEEVLHKDGHQSIYERLIAPNATNCTFSKALNRRVTGSMNDLVFQAKCYMASRDMSPFELAARLNDTPMSYLDYKYPRDAFSNLKAVQRDA